MRLVVDANILVAELIRLRGRELIVHSELELYMAEKAWDEACHELSKRVAKMVQKGIFSQDAGQDLLADAIAPAPGSRMGHPGAKRRRLKPRYL